MKTRPMTVLDQLVLQAMPVEDVPIKAQILGRVLAKAPPDITSAYLCATVANIIGNIPDDHWKAMTEFKFPACSTPDCDCHLKQEALIKALIPIRELFERATGNPDEKGLAE